MISQKWSVAEGTIWLRTNIRKIQSSECEIKITMMYAIIEEADFEWRQSKEEMKVWIENTFLVHLKVIQKEQYRFPKKKKNENQQLRFIT